MTALLAALGVLAFLVGVVGLAQEDTRCFRARVDETEARIRGRKCRPTPK